MSYRGIALDLAMPLSSKCGIFPKYGYLRMTNKKKTKMKHTSLAAFFMVILLTAGCSSGTSESSGSTQTQTESSPAPPAQDTGTAQPANPAPVNPPHGEPGHVHSADEGASPAPQGIVKLNPPHGEPGHRCDIPVGQPLP